MALEDRLLSWSAAARDRLRLVRLPLLIAGTVFFLVGIWWSFKQLDLTNADFRLAYLPILLLMIPVSLSYSGIGLQVIALSGGIRMRLGKATMAACHAQLAEALPIPGGAIVRSGALMASGLGLVQSVTLVTANAVLWIALAALGAGIAILASFAIAGAILIAVGAGGASLILGWLVWKAGLRIAMYSLAHRGAGIVLLSLRLFFAFQVIGMALPLMNVLPVTLATVAGSAVSITPAGLGISEALAALIASAVQIAPAAAFLAVGLDRVIVFMGFGAVALTAQARSAAKTN